MDFFAIMLLLFALAGFAGAVIGRTIFSGGWDKREVHACGWHESHNFNIHFKYGGPCPRCGSEDKHWRLAVGRPIPLLPFGWEWMGDPPSDIRSTIVEQQHTAR